MAKLPAISDQVAENWVLLHGGPMPQPPLGSALGSQLDEVYETWVGLEEKINRAREQLQAVLANRKTATILRDEARRVIAQADSAWTESQRVGDAAWRAFNQSFAEGLRDPASRWRFVREIYEAKMAQARIQNASNKDAWAEADRVREAATGELLNALNAIGAAAARAERELRETASLPAGAESMLVAAMENLRYAQMLGSDLAQLGQGAVDQLDAARIVEQARRTTGQALVSPPQQAPPQQFGGAPGRMYADPAGQQVRSPNSGAEVPAQPAAPKASGTQERKEAAYPAARVSEAAAGPSGTASPSPAAPQGNGPPSAAESLRREMEAAAARMRSQQHIEPAAGEITDGSKTSRPDVVPPGAGRDTAAEELERELASLRDLFAAPGPPGGAANTPPAPGTAARRVVDGGIVSRLPGQAPAPGETPARPGGGAGFQANQSQAGQSHVVTGAASSGNLQTAYTGRLYLMFPSSLNQDALESVWEVLEEVAGVGSIVDNQLVSREAGIQFTLDLRSRPLVLEEMRTRMPGVGLTELAADRLKVDWQPRP